MNHAACFAMALGLSALASIAPAEPVTVLHDGLKRLIWVDNGRPDPTISAPLVLAIHGYRTPDTAAAQRDDPASLAWPELQSLTQRDGFVALYPAAYQGQWAVFDGLPTPRPMTERT